MIKNISIFSILCALSLTSTSFAASATLGPSTTSTTNAQSSPVITRTLTIGSYGQDVMALKKILGLDLNMNIDTSPNFTADTATAVKKFQEKYAVEILIPSGLSAGTGTVGQATINKLNTLAVKYYIKISDFTLPVIVATVKSSFTSALSLGSTGDEVTLLKTILNSDKDTALIPQNSTNIFDSATVVAVNKFQMKYASEILAPSGLKSGTGTVGPATRKKLNSMINSIINASKLTNVGNTVVASSSSIQPFGYSTVTSYLPNPDIDPNVTYAASGTIQSQKCVGTTLVSVYNDGTGGTITVSKARSLDGGCYNPNTTAQITGFQLNTPGITNAVIDDVAKTITVYIPPAYYPVYSMKEKSKIYDDVGKKSDFSSTTIATVMTPRENPPLDLTKIKPTISAIGDVSPASKVQVDLSKSIIYPSTYPSSYTAKNANYVPVKYTVVSQSGATSTYSVTVTPIDCYDFNTNGLYFYGDVPTLEHMKPGGDIVGYRNPPSVSDFWLYNFPAEHAYWMPVTIADIYYLPGTEILQKQYCPLPNYLKPGQRVDIVFPNDGAPNFGEGYKALGILNPSISFKRNVCPGFLTGFCDGGFSYYAKTIEYGL